MTLPIVIIFERHWDTIPKQFLIESLPQLKAKGYSVLCQEYSKTVPQQALKERIEATIQCDSKIIEQTKDCLDRKGIRSDRLSAMSFSKLKDLMRLYVSSQNYSDVAEKIKKYAALCLHKKIIESAERNAFEMEGVDIEEFEQVGMNADLEKMIAFVIQNEEKRDETIFRNLLKLQQSEKGVVFLCGSLHAKPLLEKFRQVGMENDIVCCHPHSHENYEDGYDDIQIFSRGDSSLTKKAKKISSEDVEKSASEFIDGIAIAKEIHGFNSHTNYLSEHFGVKFRSFLKSGYHLDAVLTLDDANPEIATTLTKHTISAYKTAVLGEEFLVIPNVNSESIAKAIRTL